MPARCRFLLPIGGYRAAVAAAIALASLAVSPRASAYCRTTTCTGACAVDDHGCTAGGVPLAWPGLCAGYSLDARGTRRLSFDDVRGAAARAFAAWSGLPCDGGTGSIALAELATVACDVVGYDERGPNANIVTFRDDGWPYANAEDALALTTVTFDVKTGAIYDADVEVNSSAGPLRVTDGGPGFDLQAILTHEAGHFLGLSHSDAGSSVMAPTYSPDRRVPASDDVAAACAAYPPGRAGTCDPTPRHGFAPSCPEPAAAEAHGGCRAARRPVSSGPSLVAVLALVGARGLRRRATKRGA